MNARKAVLITALGLSVAAGHALYPVALGVAARLFGRVPERPLQAMHPAVTVIIPAYLERGVIAQKIDNVRMNGYPGEVIVLVVADGDPSTAETARNAGAKVLLLSERGGKSQALNAGVEAAFTEYIVMTDANTEMTDGSLERLVSWLADESVGAVAGEKLEGEGGELAYWRFTSWIKQNEWRLGSTIAMDGGLCAVRKSAWEPIPKDVSCDDFWISLDMNDRGHRVAYEPQAIVREESIGGLGLSWERRTRVLGSSLLVMSKKGHLLSPTAGWISGKVWGHKLWRSSVGPLSHVALLALAAREIRTSPVAQAFLAGNALAAGFVWAESCGAELPRPASLIAQVAYLQAVALGGIYRFAMGDKALQWKKPAR